MTMTQYHEDHFGDGKESFFVVYHLEHMEAVCHGDEQCERIIIEWLRITNDWSALNPELGPGGKYYDGGLIPLGENGEDTCKSAQV